MSRASVADWLRLRSPEVPAAFRPSLQPGRPELPVSARTLGGEARLRLAEIDQAGSREGAFHLLAADGFATWAAERALEEDDPATALRELLDLLIA